MMKQKSRSFCINLRSLSSHSFRGALKITQVYINLQSLFNRNKLKVNCFIGWFLSYRNHSVDLLCKSVDWFLSDRDLLDERVK